MQNAWPAVCHMKKGKKKKILRWLCGVREGKEEGVVNKERVKLKIRQPTWQEEMSRGLTNG